MPPPTKITSVLQAPPGTPVRFWYGNMVRHGVSLCRIGDEVLVSLKPKARSPDEYYRGEFDLKGFFTPRHRYTESSLPMKWREALKGE